MGSVFHNILVIFLINLISTNCKQNDDSELFPQVKATQFPILIPPPQPCYIIKLDANTTATLVSTKITRNFTSSLKSYTFTNCTTQSSLSLPLSLSPLTKPSSLSATGFLLPLALNSSGSEKGTLTIELTFNHTSQNYGISNGTGVGFYTPGKKFALSPLDLISTNQTVPLHLAGRCGSYRLQSKPEKSSHLQLTVTLRDLKFEVIQKKIGDLNAASDLTNIPFSKKDVPICTTTGGGTDVRATTFVGIGFTLLLLVSRIVRV